MMISRIGWLGLFSFFIFASPASGQNQKGGWEQANQLYQKGQYGDAAEAYKTLLKAAPANPYLHYNLGNAYFKDSSSTSLGLAISEYLRAFQLLPRDSDIRYNLDFALKRSGESLVPSGVPETMHLAFYLASESELLGLFWIGWWLSLLCISVWLLSEERIRSKLEPCIWTGLTVLLLSGSWWGLRRMASIPNPGVILEANSEARSGPGSNFPVSFNAPEGRRVSILSQEGDWVEIDMLKEALRGWVSAKAVERVDAL